MRDCDLPLARCGIVLERFCVVQGKAFGQEAAELKR